MSTGKGFKLHSDHHYLGTVAGRPARELSKEKPVKGINDERWMVPTGKGSRHFDTEAEAIAWARLNGFPAFRLVPDESYVSLSGFRVNRMKHEKVFDPEET